MKYLKILLVIMAALVISSCSQKGTKTMEKSAADILGNPEYLAFSYGGYREKTRDLAPTVEDLKEDMRILSAMGVKIIRTYNSQQFPMAANLLKAIRQLKEEDSSFEMYVMIGAWIDCKGAWTNNPDHESEDIENNSAEIQAAVEMANANPDIVKIIAVGNEAMVHWAASYFVRPSVILKWVDHLQGLKKTGELPPGTWITSSDNFASWGGDDESYHSEDLVKLINAVDYISLHTYPFHDSHYNNDYWTVPEEEENLSVREKADAAMERARNRAISQYQSTKNYMASLGIEKPIHIGETGWATRSGSLYGPNGSKAADEYKQKLYYEHMREWTLEAGMSCFYFEAFDEQWKDPVSEAGSENHFGLFTIGGEAKYVIWDLVDNGTFEGLSRNGNPITKTNEGDENKVMAETEAPPLKSEFE